MTKLSRVWLLLVEVRVVSENFEMLTVGSSALIQCFVPTHALEKALEECDIALHAEGLLRTDVLKCSSFEESEYEDEDDPPQFVRRDVEQARATGKPLIGTYFVSQDSATFKQPLPE